MENLEKIRRDFRGLKIIAKSIPLSEKFAITQNIIMKIDFKTGFKAFI